MECTLATLIACFSWSNLYLDSHVSWIDSTYPVETHYVSAQPVSESALMFNYSTVIDDKPANPYGGLTLGYEIEFRSVTIGLEAAHMLSSMSTGKDKGVNAVSLRLRWYPLRRK